MTVVLPAADTSTVQGWVFFETTDNLTRATVLPDTTASGAPVRAFKVKWAGLPSASIRIHAFQAQVDPATSAPVHYLGYDTTDLVLGDQGDITWTASYKPLPFPESPLSVTVSLPEGYAVSEARLLTNLAWPGVSSVQVGNGAEGSEISLVLPDLPGAPFVFGVSAYEGYAGSWSGVPGLPAGTQKLALQMEPAPTLLSPSQGATFGVGSTITWTPGGPGVSYTTLNLMEGDGSLITLWGGEEGSVTVPDLSPLGLPLPPGATYMVTAWRDSRATTVEDIVSRNFAPGPWTRAFSAASQVTTP